MTPSKGGNASYVAYKNLEQAEKRVARFEPALPTPFLYSHFGEALPGSRDGNCSLAYRTNRVPKGGHASKGCILAS